MRRIMSTAAILMVSAAAATAQDRTPQQPPAPAAQPAAVAAKGGMTPTARLQVVLARFNGEKRVANQPYVVVTVANGTAKVLRTGAEVPIAGGAGTKDSPSYKSIGTNIVANVTLYDDGRYLVSLTVESASPYPDDQKQAGRPAFRNYNLSGMVYLRDGQTAEVASATDSLTGEVIKIEATVNAVK